MNCRLSEYGELLGPAYHDGVVVGVSVTDEAFRIQIEKDGVILDSHRFVGTRLSRTFGPFQKRNGMTCQSVMGALGVPLAEGSFPTPICTTYLVGCNQDQTAGHSSYSTSVPEVRSS